MELILIIATLLGGATALWFLWEKTSALVVKNQKEPSLNVYYHFMNLEIEAFPYNGIKTEIRFTLTNDSTATVKLIKLLIAVDQVKPYTRIVLPDIGAPKEEYTLEADIRDKEQCDLLIDQKVQFVLNANESEAFRVECIGKKGHEYLVHFECIITDLSDGNKQSFKSEEVVLKYPVQSIEDMPPEIKDEK